MVKSTRKVVIFILLCWHWETCICIPNVNTEFELIYPERIHLYRSKRDLSTKIEDEHDDNVTFKIPTKGQDYILDLKKLDKLHPGSIRVLSYDKNGNSHYDDHVPADCHYHGSIRGNSISNVYISTCNGLTGSVDDGMNNRYDIEPRGAEGEHVIYSVDKELEDIHSKLQNSYKAKMLERKSRHRRSLLNSTTPRKYQLFNIEPQYVQYLTTNRTRYIEMFVSVDHGMLNHYQNKDVILERVLNTLGQVDISYQAIGIRIVLVAMEIQTSSRFQRKSRTGEDLASFNNYCRDVIKKSDAFKNIRIDNFQLFSTHHWIDYVGMAYIGGMCSHLSASVNAWSFSSVSGPSLLLGHELGHNMNFPHDGGHCKCLSVWGCLMGGGKSIRPGFSDCNMKRLAEKEFACLNDEPKAPMLIRCGNGIQEPDEECDCGTPENCLKNGDNCCQPHDCKLKPTAQCSHMNNPGCCSEQCFIRKQGTLCREANGNCDVEEYCTGGSAECPTDHVVRNGIPCSNNIKLLFGTRRGMILTTTDLSPDVIGRYFKFVPKLWTKNDWACMKIEMLGCNPGKDCVLPQVGTLPESSFTAGPSSKGHEAYKASLQRHGHWRPASREIGSWLQIDLGTPKRIQKIQIKGSYWSGVTGYHLYFSEDGSQWKSYKESGVQHWDQTNSMCFEGKCAKTYNHQCQELWNADATKADDTCWSELNIKANRYGTCDPIANMTCQAGDAFCGQLQCKAFEEKPYYIDYGTSYAKLNFEKSTCSAAMITNSEQAGMGMVEDGTRCDEKKMCIDQKCKTVEDHKIVTCKNVNGEECNGKGVCREDGVCQCKGKLNPKDGCFSELPGVNGGWSNWEEWTVCSKGCDGGTQTRLRYCNQPVPINGGEDCKGSKTEKQNCNEEKCPIGRSCRSIKLILEKEERPLYDGVYTISPKEGTTFEAYCDMTKNGGGWTLLVSSHTNTWTADNVRLRNGHKPNLTTDYSILKFADEIKYNYLISTTTFEYRLEAHTRGEWGGIWEAPAAYFIDSTDKNQENVKLIKKFGPWEYSRIGINERLPYVYKQRITLSPEPSNNFWGSITDNRKHVLPSNWIHGTGMMTQPEHIWYWMREGDYKYPKSCLDVLFRSLKFKILFKSGVYKIEVNDNVVETYCDLDRYGGGWTLIVKSSSSNGWNKGTALNRNSNNTNKPDYSIFQYIDDIKHSDPSEKSFQYMLETKENENGGIFSLVADFTLLSCPPKGKIPSLLKKFGTWNENVENFLQYPVHLAAKNGIFVTASSYDTSDTKGTIISNSQGPYMTNLKNPDVVKLWVREGGSRKSCNDIKIHGLHKGKRDYKDGFYLIEGMHPVYCDMETTKNEGWTLLVSSNTNGWTGDQVLERNEDRPSLIKDYSILKKADDIKSLSNGKTFKYMLDAKKRRNWGGIWKAPISYSFVQKSNVLKDVTLLQQFSKWEYEKNWWSNPRKRMPYLGNPERNKALLTTANYDHYTEWGTIVAKGSSEVPAMWMYPTMKSPGAIWYWVNENDCDPDYRKIDGEYSEWSLWTECSSFCGQGNQTRIRLCNSPVPRCGGGTCDAKSKTFEEQSCTGQCQYSKIITSDARFCYQPEKGSCNPLDDTKIVLRPVAKCSVPESEFVFNPATGDLIHKCSNKPVCPQNGGTGYGTRLVVGSACKDPTPDLHLKRTLYNAIQYGTLCLETNGGRAIEGRAIILWSGCKNENKRFNFPNIAKGSVKVSFYDSMKIAATVEDVLVAPSYPNSPTDTGWMDTLDSEKNVADYYALRLESLFFAPQTGVYVFVVSCDDKCKVYLSTTETAANKTEIIHMTSHTGFHFWHRSPKQNSTGISLIVGHKYYIEGILLEKAGGDHISIGVYLPNGDPVLPISSQYLKNVT